MEQTSPAATATSSIFRSALSHRNSCQGNSSPAGVLAIVDRPGLGCSTYEDATKSYLTLEFLIKHNSKLNYVIDFAN